jgi:hypothetical protein
MVGSQLDPVQAERRGATWSYQSFDTHATGNDVFAVIDRGRWVD